MGIRDVVGNPSPNSYFRWRKKTASTRIDAVAIDLSELFQYAHAKAGFPCPNDLASVVKVICDIRDYCRNAHSETAPPCVFVFDGRVHVHQPTLRLWRSTPPGGNERLSVSQVRQSLLASGFATTAISGSSCAEHATNWHSGAGQSPRSAMTAWKSSRRNLEILYLPPRSVPQCATNR